MAQRSDVPFASPVADGVRISVRLSPGAKRTAIQGAAPDADGGAVLKASVTAVPEHGKANEALVKLLAKEWRLPKSSFSILSGATDRRKVLHIAGEPGVLLDRIAGAGRT